MRLGLVRKFNGLPKGKSHLLWLHSLFLVAVLCDRLSTTTSLDTEHQKHVRAKSQRVSCITSEVSHEAMATVVPASLTLSFAGNTAMSLSF